MTERTKPSRPPGTARSAPAVRAAAVWLAAALAAGACGGGSPAAETSSGTPASTESPSGAEAGAEPAGEEPAGAGSEAAGEDEPESLSDYLGFDIDDPDASAAQFAESERRAQELIALCMAAEGFEYVPVDPAATSFSVQVDDAGTEEYARDYGFGITTWYGREESAGQESAAADPNEAIQAAMSESERGAYMEALFGPPATDEEGEEAFDDLEQVFGAGCQGEAYREVQGRLIRMFQLLGPALQDMTERMEADPRVAEASGGWSACMADRGYLYEDQNAMYGEVFEDFGNRLDEIIGPGGGFVDPFEGWTTEEVETFMAENSEQEIEDFYEQARSEARAGVDQDAVAALQQEERDLAVANFECGRELEDVMEEVWPEYERGFIEENREQLGQVRDG